MLLKQILKDPQIYVFGEILDAPNVKGLAGTEHEPYLKLLQLFAYGTYQDYTGNKDGMPELGAAETKKLKQLSLVSLSETTKALPYDMLQKELDIETIRELEDLIIDSIYKGLIKGVLDQQKRSFEVQHAIGRDLGPNDIENMMNTLEAWLSASDALNADLTTYQEQANRTVDEAKADEILMVEQKEEVYKMIRKQQEEEGNGESFMSGLGGGGDVGGMVGSLMGSMMGGMMGHRPTKRKGQRKR